MADRLAAPQPAFEEPARHGADAPARLAVGQAEPFVALGRDLDDEGTVVRRGRIEDGGEVRRSW